MFEKGRKKGKGQAHITVSLGVDDTKYIGYINSVCSHFPPPSDIESLTFFYLLSLVFTPVLLHGAPYLYCYTLYLTVKPCCARYVPALFWALHLLQVELCCLLTVRPASCRGAY